MAFHNWTQNEGTAKRWRNQRECKRFGGSMRGTKECRIKRIKYDKPADADVMTF
jgi:hypothetical protein